MNPFTYWLLPLALLALPIYFFGKYLEKKINPRKSGLYFLLWILAVTAVSVAWYMLCLFVFFKFFPLKAG